MGPRSVQRLPAIRMTTTHTEPSPARAAERESALPAQRPRRRRRDWGRTVARALCVLLAAIGILPFAASLVVRSRWAREWAAVKTQRALQDQGVVASFSPAVRVWPLAVELDGVRVESSDGGAPAIECRQVLVRPKLFALLAGKLSIDQIDLDEPRVRAVIKDGQVSNLAIKDAGSSSKGPLHAPFTTFSVTDGSIDLQVDALLAQVRSLDLDVTAEDDRQRGSSFEVALRVGRASVHRPRVRADGSTAMDDDALCAIDGRVRYEPDALLVRRFEGVGSADLDDGPDSAPSCDLPAGDKRRVELSLGHLHVLLPNEQRRLPAIDGHVHARAPIELAGRVADLPEMDGWVGVDLDARYAEDTILPDLSGTIEAHDVRLDQYAFAQELRTEVTVRRNVVHSPKTTIRLAGGTVTLLDTVLDPLARGGRLERTRLDATGVDFTTLLRDLGIHKSSWVGWDIREIHAPLISGPLAPLKIDGDFTAKTYSFGVYDRPAEDHARQRLVGFSEAQIAAKVSIRPDALKFVDIRATLPHSHLEGGFVSIGFHDDLRVDVPHMVADLNDISPIGPVPLHGTLDASARVGGVFNRPEPEGDIHSATGFVVADVAFGDLSAGHVKVDVTKPEVEVTDVKAKRRDSLYDVPTAKLTFGGARGFVVDAVGSSAAFGLRDVLSMFAMDDDPRFYGIDASLAARADVHVALGGPEDACGGGYVAVGTKAQLRNVALYGERFAQGDADVQLHWYDRQRGIAGADVDVRSFVLEKQPPPSGTRTTSTGTVLGSASIRRGGALAANVMIEGLSLSRVDALGRFASEVEGSVSGVAHVTGNLDDFLPGAGIVARAEVDVAATRVREVPLANSHVEVGVTQRMPQQKATLARTGCGAPVGPPFDKQAYLADTSSHGEWTVNGDLLGHAVQLHDVVLTRAGSPHASGRASLRGVDLGAIARILSPAKPVSDESASAPAASPVAGQLWGEVIVDDLPIDAPSAARGRLVLGPTFVSRGGQRLTLKPPRQPLELAGDALAIPPLELMLEAGGAADPAAAAKQREQPGQSDQAGTGFRGGFVLTGSVTQISSAPILALAARLEPVDLSVLQRIVPKVRRASGKVEGSVRVTGRATAPVIAGELHARGDDVEVTGLPSAITDVVVDARASASEIAASGTGKFAGGTVSFDGSMPIRGFDVGALDSRIAVRGVRLTPTEGVAATFDADLEVAYDPKAQGAATAALPHVTGDVTIGALDYTRPIALNAGLPGFAMRARRTEVNAYDPALDFLTLDLHLRTRVPVVIKNNLVEVQLAIESGTLDVTGTNQRIGLRGALRTLPGGRIHFQANDFEVRQGRIRFDDPTRVAPNVDVTAVTEYRRYTDTGASAGAGVGGGGPSAASTGSTRGGSLWRITLHAYGDADDLRVDMTSEPTLSQEDIVLLLTVGMTRAELDQLGASSIGESIALNYLGAASGADRAVKQALPIIDDFRFGSAYSTGTGKTEPQLTVGKRLTNDFRASVTAGLSEDRELRSNIEWRLNNRLSVQGSYDNINDASSSTLGNLGADLRWRLEFE
jgi:translocation and assembly module TamB